MPADRLRLAGRDAELDRLRAAWEAACGHRAGFVLLAGEPGIGKSRLLEELADLARRSGGAVLSGRAFEGERSVFAQPLVDALASAAESLPADRLRAAAAGRRHPRPAGAGARPVHRRGSRAAGVDARRRAVAELRRR